MRDDSAMIVRRDGDVIRNKFPGAGPVLKGPLRVDRSLAPAYNRWLAVANGF